MKLNLIEKFDFSELKSFEKKDFEIGDSKNCALFIIDMNNGFSKKGLLYSPRVEAIINDIVDIAEIFTNNNLPIIAHTDYHTKECLEFRSYPLHCLEGTEEVEIIDELKTFSNSIKVIRKNSTNAFLNLETQEHVKELIKKGIRNFIVVGCCTDICIMQFTLTLRAYLNENDIEGEVYVPLKGVETYDAPWHNGDLMNIFSLYTMKQNGVNIVNNVKK